MYAMKQRGCRGGVHTTLIPLGATMDDYGNEINEYAAYSQHSYDSLMHWYFSDEAMAEGTTINAGCFREWN
jgi:hypothetical protein